MTSSPVQNARIEAQSLVAFLAGIWSCRGPDKLPSVWSPSYVRKTPNPL